MLWKKINEQHGKSSNLDTMCMVQAKCVHCIPAKMHYFKTLLVASKCLKNEFQKICK